MVRIYMTCTMVNPALFIGTSILRRNTIQYKNGGLQSYIFSEDRDTIIIQQEIYQSFHWL